MARAGRSYPVESLRPRPSTGTLQKFIRSAASSAPVSGSTNRTVTAPAGIQNGDVLVAVCVGDSTNFGHIAPPAGWSSALINSQSGATNLEFVVFTKIASGEGASWTFTTVAAADTAFGVIALSPDAIDTNTANWVVQAAASWATLDAPSLTGTGV